MDYTINPADYLINELKDNHLLKGEPIEAGEGLIAVLKACDEDIYSHKSIVLYRDSSQDTDTSAAWCSKTILDDGAIEYTLIATTPINEDVEIGTKVYTGADEYGEVYFIGVAETNWYEFTLQYIEKHVFVEKGANLAKNLEDLLERLEKMKADKLLENILVQESSGIATINGAEILSNETPEEYTITYTNPDYKTSEVVAENYEVRLFKMDGTPAPKTVSAVLTNKSKDSVTVKIIGFKSGSYKAEIIYSWTENSTDQMRMIKAKATLASWVDPIIMTESNAVYNQLESYGMMLSPAAANLLQVDESGTRIFPNPINGDLNIFKASHNLNKGQIINPEVLAVCVAQNFATASSVKVNYLKDQGLSQAEAEALAVKFMTLSEAMKVTKLQDNDNNVFTNNTNITHFESFGYFVGFTTIGQNSFKDCSNLTVIYLPVTIEIIESGCFENTVSLMDIQTLMD